MAKDEKEQTLFSKVLRKFGYAPIRDTSQITPELAEEQQYAGSPADTNDWLKTYTESIWSYVCVNKIGTSCAKIPFKFYKKRVTKKGQRQELTEGDLVELSTRVNPWMTRFGLWDSTISFALLTGNSYWELCTDGKSNRPKEIYLLRPDRMKIIPDPKTFISGYIYNINGKNIPFKPDDILHFKTFSPLSDYYGTPPTQPSSLLIALDLYSLKYNTNFFKAGARIYGVLETERSLSDRAVKRLERKWIGKYGGYQKAFRTAVLEEGLKYKPISSTHKDMDFIAQMKIVRESICSCFGVYPAVVGLFEYSNYSNAAEQRQFFYEETIIPHLTWLQEYVTAFLCPKFGPRIIGEFDQSAIGALKEKEEIKARKSGILKKYDILSTDEIRDKFYDMGKYEGKENKGIEKLNSAGTKRIREIIDGISGNLNAREELSNIIRAMDDGGERI